MNITVTNSGAKHRWLRLNNGDYVGIAPGGSLDIDEAAVVGNAAFQKLKDRHQLAVSEIQVGKPKAAAKAKRKRASSKKTSKKASKKRSAKKAKASRRSAS